MRICSLTPSGTEILCALGLLDEIVGVSHRCDYPPEVLGKPVVSQLLVRKPSPSSIEIDSAVHQRATSSGALYELDAGILQQLRPDLIVTQDVCEVCAVPSSLAHAVARGLLREPLVVSVTASSLADILSNIRRLGVVVQRQSEAEMLVARMEQRIRETIRIAAKAPVRPRVAFLEWLDPPWVAGNWIPELIALAGGIDGLGSLGQRSRQVDWSEIVAYQPEVLLLAPCGLSIERTLAELPRYQQREEWSALPAVRGGRVYVLDGALYSRYGPRVVDGLEALAILVHPELYPGMPPDNLARPVDSL